MFKSHGGKKSAASLPFVIFRMLLSFTIFFILLFGLYSAYTHFSGVDPLRMDPQALILNLKSSKNPNEFITKLAQEIKLPDPQNALGIATANPTAVASNSAASANPTTNSPVLFSFLLVADSHNESNYLQKALEQGKSKAKNLKLVIGLGDYTEVGTIKELTAAKKEFDAAGIRYFLTAGDHDLWDSRDKQKAATENFVSVFGEAYQSFNQDGVQFLIINNSDNYIGLGQSQQQWLDQELARIKTTAPPRLILTFMHEPLFHPSSTRVMGKVDDKLLNESKNLIRLLKNNNVKEVFYGDIHYYTRYSEPETGLSMMTVGAVASLRNTQSPRFAIVTVYQDGTYQVEDVEIK